MPQGRNFYCCVPEPSAGPDTQQVAGDNLWSEGMLVSASLRASRPQRTSWRAASVSQLPRRCSRVSLAGWETEAGAGAAGEGCWCRDQPFRPPAGGRRATAASVYQPAALPPPRGPPCHGLPRGLGPELAGSALDVSALSLLRAFDSGPFPPSRTLLRLSRSSPAHRPPHRPSHPRGSRHTGAREKHRPRRPLLQRSQGEEAYVGNGEPTPFPSRLVATSASDAPPGRGPARAGQGGWGCGCALGRVNMAGVGVVGRRCG